MIKSLETLIKLQKEQVNEQRLVLAKLQAHLERVEAGIAALHKRAKEEEDFVRSQNEIAVTYEAFLAHVRDEADKLAQNKRTAIQAVEMARDKLSELFEEQKRYEIALDHKKEELLREEKRKENLELDEIGSQRHERQRK